MKTSTASHHISAPGRSSQRISSRVQRNWDWRAAGNFIGGGVGSGLILWGALIGLFGIDPTWLMLAGLALVGGGLFCVWLEIGRPWRALNVFKHVSTSWMTREACVAPLLFAAGAGAWLLEPLLIWPTALLAVSFLYSQSRILQADKGIPAWRHPRCAQLVVVTGLTEGAGLLLLMLPLLAEFRFGPVLLLMPLLAARGYLWHLYRTGLAQASAPPAARRALAQINFSFLVLGHLLPLLLLVASLIVPQLALPASMVAGLLAMLSGAWMKYNLICRASYTQGFSMQHMPVRGQPSPHRQGE